VEPGDRLVFSGHILDYQGQPLSKASVVAYHADRTGLYNPVNSRSRVPRLRGVAITDEKGEYRFSTIRPGPYPDESEPAHIHVVVTAPAHHVRHVAFRFEGDPLITERLRGEAARAGETGETVIVKAKLGSGGVWAFRQDIRLEGN
jgi:protocatechuate 3,4-dioxygenase beta subunit